MDALYPGGGQAARVLIIHQLYDMSWRQFDHWESPKRRRQMDSHNVPVVFVGAGFDIGPGDFFKPVGEVLGVGESLCWDW